MPSSGYTAITFVANEQPTTAKWNLIGSNDSSFNLGTGLEDSVIITRHLAAGNVTTPKTKLDIINILATDTGGGDQTTSSTTFVDVTNTSGNYTAPAGNGVTLLLWGRCDMVVSTANTVGAVLAINVNGSVITGNNGGHAEANANTTVMSMGKVNVAAGATVPIKLQMKMLGAGTVTVSNSTSRVAQQVLPNIFGFAISQ